MRGCAADGMFDMLQTWPRTARGACAPSPPGAAYAMAHHMHEMDTWWYTCRKETCFTLPFSSIITWPHRRSHSACRTSRCDNQHVLACAGHAQVVGAAKLRRSLLKADLRCKDVDFQAS